ncbi:complex I NDUFA9 subunit family protein [Cribrihabitans sp. XS_ASV171]
MPRQKLIAVFGGTGFLGRRVADRLLTAGHRVRIAARNPRRQPDLLQRDGVEACRADLFMPDTLEAALKGADGVVNATSLYVERGELTYRSVHVDAAARLARLTHAAGVNRYLQLSGIGADPEAGASYIRARGQGEAAVRAEHPDATIIRSAVMFGDDEGLLATIRDVLRRLPVYPLFGAGETRLQPVCVQDVAEAIAQLLEPEAPAPLYELAGADIVTYRDLVEHVGENSPARARPVPVPFKLWDVLAGIAQRLPSAPLTRAQVALMQIDTVASGRYPGLSDIGITPRGVIGYLRDRSAPPDRGVD